MDITITLKDDELDKIQLALFFMQDSVERRIYEARGVIKKTGQINKFSRTVEDKYTYDEINKDTQLLKEIGILLNKIDKAYENIF